VGPWQCPWGCRRSPASSSCPPPPGGRRSRPPRPCSCPPPAGHRRPGHARARRSPPPTWPPTTYAWPTSLVLLRHIERVEKRRRLLALHEIAASHHGDLEQPVSPDHNPEFHVLLPLLLLDHDLAPG